MLQICLSSSTTQLIRLYYMKAESFSASIVVIVRVYLLPAITRQVTIYTSCDQIILDDVCCEDFVFFCLQSMIHLIIVIIIQGFTEPQSLFEMSRLDGSFVRSVVHLKADFDAICSKIIIPHSGKIAIIHVCRNVHAKRDLYIVGR